MEVGSTCTARASMASDARQASASESSLCEECEEAEAALTCEDCGLVYCIACDKRRHRKGKLVFHQRQRLGAEAEGCSVETPEQMQVQAWTSARVGQWLREHGLQVFLAPFEARGIDGGSLLSSQVEGVLETVGEATRGQKKKLLREVMKLKAETETESETSSTATASTAAASPIVTPVKPAEGTARRRMGFNLHVNVNVDAQRASAPERRFSPVAAVRSRIVQGQFDGARGNVVRRQTLRGSAAIVDADLDENAATPLANCALGEGRRGNSAIAPIMMPAPLHIALDPQSPEYQGPRSGLKSVRQVLGGLDLDMVNVRRDGTAVEASFDFSAEGRLQTQGFEINTEGIKTAPFPQPPSKSPPTTGTREFLMLLNELGHGAGGKVFKALYLPTFQLVAVKVIRVFDQQKRHQMVRELKSLYFNHVSLTDQAQPAACHQLVRFFDAYTNPEMGSVSIVLEYMDAGSLEDRMQEKQPCSESELATLAQGALRGLAFLHEHHQLHRDIKLSNMLMDQQGNVKISDFGISRDLESTLAKATTFTGTLLYMAPERISGGTYSFPSDIWSFGLAMMALAIGKLPVPTKEGYWGVVHAVQDQPSPKLSDYDDHFSLELTDFIDQCLRKNPLTRPTATALLQHPFIVKNAIPSSYSPQPPLTQEQEMKQTQELDQIAQLTREWCESHALDLRSTTTTMSTMFHQHSHHEKIQTLAAHLHLPEQVVANKFAFLNAF